MLKEDEIEARNMNGEIVLDEDGKTVSIKDAQIQDEDEELEEDV